MPNPYLTGTVPGLCLALLAIHFTFTPPATSAEPGFRQALAFVLKHEGGWSNDTADPGGLTRRGVTLKGLRARGIDFNGDGRTDSRDLEAMTLAQHAAYLRAHYWAAIRADALPAPVALLAFDAAVNQGPAATARFLQRAAGARADGVVGRATLGAVASAWTSTPATLLCRISAERLAAYRQSARFARFGRGWTARLAAATALAQRLAGLPEACPEGAA